MATVKKRPHTGQTQEPTDDSFADDYTRSKKKRKWTVLNSQYTTHKMIATIQWPETSVQFA